MQSTLNPKPSDDPHDFVVVPPDVVGVAPANDELSNLLQKAARQRPDPPTRTAPADSTVPPVDTTFRPAVDGAPAPGSRASIARRLGRGIAALLLATCIGVAGVAWKSYGDVARKQIAKWTTQFVLVAPQPSEPAAAAAPAAPAVQAEAATAASPPSTAPAQSTAETAAPAATSAPEAVAPSPESAQLLQSMSRDLASLGQEVEQLKAGMEQLKTSQQQMSRDMAKVSEQNARPKIAPPRPATARTRKPVPAYQSYPSTQAAAARVLPPPPAPYYSSRQTDYVPRQAGPAPQATYEPQQDPELSAVPRPPMPMRDAN